MPHEFSPERAKHRSEARDDGAPLEHIADVELPNREDLQGMYDLIEALYLECLDEDEEVKAKKLIENDPDARAYWAKLQGDDESISSDIIGSVHEKLLESLPWLAGPRAIDSKNVAKFMASLHNDPLRGLSAPGIIDEERKKLAAHPMAISPAPAPYKPAIAAVLDQLNRPSTPEKPPM